MKTLIPSQCVKNEIKLIKNDFPQSDVKKLMKIFLHYISFKESSKKINNSKDINTVDVIELLNIKNSILTNLFDYGVELNTISFIDNEIKIKLNRLDKINQIDLCIFLMFSPFMYHGLKPIINTDTWEIDKVELLKLVSEIKKDLNEKIPTKNTRYLECFLSENKTYEIVHNTSRIVYQALRAKQEKINSGESAFLKLIIKLELKEIFLDDFFEEIVKIIELEKKYRISFNSNIYNYDQKKSSYYLKTPSLGDIKESENSESFVKNKFKIAKKVNKKQNILNKFFEKSKYFELEKSELRKNILITGETGSGKSMLFNHFILNNIINDIGSMLIVKSECFDKQLISLIYSFSKHHNKKEIKILDQSQMKEVIRLKKFKNKEYIESTIIYIDDGSNNVEYKDIFFEIYNAIDNNGIYPYSILLDEAAYFDKEVFDNIEKNLPYLNRKNINFVISSQLPKKDLSDCLINELKTKLIFKNRMFNLDLFGDQKEFPKLSNGEFHVVKNNKILDEIYRVNIVSSDMYNYEALIRTPHC